MIQGEINSAVAHVTHCIITAATISIQKSFNLSKKYCKPWWNDNCKSAKKLQQKAWGIFRRYPTASNYITFKKARAYARRIRKKSQ